MELPYEGLKKGYPRLRKRLGKLADYVILCRPLTLVAPLFAGMFGVLTQLATYNQLNLFFTKWPTVIYVAVTLILAQGCGQVLNQASEPELDKIVKPYRPIPSGRVTVEEAMGIGFLLCLLSLARAFTVNVTFGAFIATILFFAVFYNLEPIRAKRYLGLNLAWMAVSRGLLPWLASWSVFGGIHDFRPWLLGGIATAWVFALQGTKDIGDVEGDRKFGIRTLAVVYGVDKATKIMTALLICPFVLTVLFKEWVMLLLIPVAVMGIYGLRKTTELVENNWGWLCFYLGLSLIYVLSFLAEATLQPLSR